MSSGGASQSPRRSIRNVTSALQSASSAAVSATTPRALIRDLLGAPATTVRRARGARGSAIGSRVVDEAVASGAAASSTAAAEALTPRNLIRNVVNFDTPFTSRFPVSNFASTTAAQLPPPPPPLFMQQQQSTSVFGGTTFPHLQHHHDGRDLDDDARDDVAVGPRVRRGASAADRAHVRDLQAQLAAIGHQFVDPGAPVATLALFPPGAASAARRVGKRVMTREHIDAIQRGRAAHAKRKKEAAQQQQQQQQQTLIGGASARRHADDDDDDDVNNADAIDGARGKKRRVSSMMPGSFVKDLFLAHTAPGVTLGSDVVKTVLKLSDQYWTRVVDDLCAYADTKPRGGAVVSADDVELLFSRQRLTNNSRSVDDLAREFLPADLRREVVPIARANNVVEPALAHRQKKKQQRKKKARAAAEESVP